LEVLASKGIKSSSGLQVAYRSAGANAFNLIAPKAVTTDRVVVTAQSSVDGEWMLVASTASQGTVAAQFTSGGTVAMARFSTFFPCAIAIVATVCIKL
jgi:hypothetical protein